ncbi:MAG: ABC-2 transporter permease [Bacilli bacterium]|nr:ABC-2 transporter permease [Bacilli bacterium]
MKALLFKEFRLAVHPICYFFILFFPLLILAPNYPMGIGFLYTIVSYPILFLGANKGQQSNDLYFTTLLPVRKKDIVKARTVTVMIMHILFTAITLALLPLAKEIITSVAEEGGEAMPGLTINEYGAVIGLAYIGLGITDLIFFPLYYRNGKSIVLSTLISTFFFAFYIMGTTMALPYIMPGFTGLICGSILSQVIFAVICFAFYLGMHWLVYIVSAKLLEKVDF